VSESLASLRHKLEAAQHLGSVVRAMKAIAASSIGQYEMAVQALGQYQRSVELGLSLCLRDSPPVTANRAITGVRHTGALVFGSDQGLVGRFNEVIAEYAQQTLAELPGPKTLWAVGERVCPPLEAAGLTIGKRFVVPSSVTGITALVTEIQLEIDGYMAGERYGEVYIFHNSPRVAALYDVTSERLLPLDAAWYRRLSAIPWPGTRTAQVLGGGTASLAGWVHERLFISLYSACAESLASENASRLEAMQRAEKNIESVAEDLRRSLNRLRQSSIDEELFDVVAGFNALA
jgi:F-type H+-transporting ATPase subunit gamma